MLRPDKYSRLYPITDEVPGMDGSAQESAEALVDRLCEATNAHDLEGIVGCFAEDYRNETPAHPARGFVGREQVRRNWQQIFAFVPDVAARVLASSVDGDTVWTEWEHSGTRADGSTHLMRGVIIFGVRSALVSWARFYLEPVDADVADADTAVQRLVSPVAGT
jgi:ketosteroid isomerase-like protein